MWSHDSAQDKESAPISPDPFHLAGGGSGTRVTHSSCMAVNASPSFRPHSLSFIAGDMQSNLCSTRSNFSFKKPLRLQKFNMSFTIAGVLGFCN